MGHVLLCGLFSGVSCPSTDIPSHMFLSSTHMFICGPYSSVLLSSTDIRGHMLL